MKLVIDTNIWISFLLGKKFNDLIKIVENIKFQIFSSNEQLFEVMDVINRPKIKKYLLDENINKLFYFLNERCIFIKLENNIKICRDPKDDYLIEIAIKSNSKYIITGDRDLLDIGHYKNIKIIKYKELLQLLNI